MEQSFPSACYMLHKDMFLILWALTSLPFNSMKWQWKKERLLRFHYAFHNSELQPLGDSTQGCGKWDHFTADLKLHSKSENRYWMPEMCFCFWGEQQKIKDYIEELCTFLEESEVTAKVVFKNVFERPPESSKLKFFKISWDPPVETNYTYEFHISSKLCCLKGIFSSQCTGIELPRMLWATRSQPFDEAIAMHY